MMPESASVRLGSRRNEPCHEDSAAASSDCAERPLGRIQRVFSVEKRWAISSSSRNRREGAGADHAEMLRAHPFERARGRRGAAGHAEQLGGALEELDAKPARLDQGDRPVAEERRRSVRGSRHRCRGRASVALSVGAKRSNWAESAKWRTQKLARLPRLIRFWCSFSSRRRRREGVQTLHCFTWNIERVLEPRSRLLFVGRIMRLFACPNMNQEWPQRPPG